MSNNKLITWPRIAIALAVLSCVVVFGNMALRGLTEPPKPLTESERWSLIVQISRNFNREMQAADFEDISDSQLSLFKDISKRCNHSDHYYFQCTEILKPENAGYIIGDRMFFSKRGVYLIGMSEAKFLYLPKRNIYLVNHDKPLIYRYHEGYDSVDSLVKGLNIPKIDAQLIWEAAMSQSLPQKE